jgi:hypothetical protein
MKLFSILLLIYILCPYAAFADDKSEREERGLKGRVKSVEYYETVFWGPESDRSHGPRALRGLELYDRKGDLLEIWLLTNDSNGPYYERHLYTYGDNHRKRTASMFRSETGKRDTWFSLGRTPSGTFDVMPHLAEALIKRISYRYDKKGRLVEETAVDAAGKTIEIKISAFDDDGRLSKYTVFKGDGTIESEMIVQTLDGGRRTETTYIRNGTDIQKEIRFRDTGDSETEEWYTLKPFSSSNVAAGPPKYKYVFVSRITRTQTGGEGIMEWKFFNPFGDATSKLIVARQNGKEVSRDEFTAGPLPPGSQNENIDPIWIAGRKTIHRRENDKRGNVVKHIWLEQKTPDAVPHIVYIFENTVTYY